MRSKHLLLMLLLALCAPWAANAQSTLTVYDGTDSNSYVPFYGLYADTQGAASECVIPSDQLTDMACGQITAMKFYISSAATAAWTGTHQVYLGEVSNATLTGITGPSDFTVVKTASFDATGTELTITFDTPYTYGGGNLLIGTYVSVAGNWKSASFNGINQTENTGWYRNSASASGSEVKFLPKTTFTYTPSPYAAPATIDYTNNSPGNTTVSWTAPTTTEMVTGYAYRYKKTSLTEWPAFETVSATTLSTTLTLDPETGYDFEVKTIYGENESCSTKKVSFTTLSSCMTPEDLTITNVTWNSATFNWTEGFGNGEWKLGYKTGNDDYTYMDVALADLPLTLDIFEENTTYSVEVYPLCDPTKKITDQFNTRCEPIDITALPNNTWAEDFTDYSNGTFTDNCWENKHISGEGTSLFAIYSSQAGYTKVMQLPDQNLGTLTKLMLPAMILPNSNYHFVLDVYRSNSTYNDSYAQEGIRVFASANGEIQGATEITFIPRQYTVSSTLIPAETAVGWYTYELPINMSGLCYIILQGESQYCTATYMDNFVVEPIPACGRPGTPMVAPNTLTNHSAKLTWTAPEGQEAWQIAYKASTTDFDPTDPESGATVIDVTTNPYTFDKSLAANQKYYMYVRGNCGTDGYSKWCKTACSFTTKEAAPKPTAVTVTNIGSTTADLYWTKGGGDFETSWDVYRVASETTPTTTPDANTQPTFTVNTLPTSEAPYEMTNLTAKTRYYLWVRANHGTDGYSDWQAMSGSYFTTQVACPKPTNVAAVPSHTTADLTWTGYSDSYTVEYQTSAYDEQLFFEDFDSGIPSTWTLHNEGNGPDWTTTTYSGESVAISYSYYGSTDYTADNWLVTPLLDLQGTLKITARDNSDGNYSDEFEVLLSTTTTETSAFTTTLIDMFSPTSTFTTYTCDLSGFSGQGYIAIHHVTTGGYYIMIDDFGIYGNSHPAGGWQVATNAATGGAYTIEGLTAGTKYDVRVKGNCGGEYSDVYTFTTLDENTKIFKTAGDWDVAGNWTPEGAPTIEQNAIIKANVIVPANCDATANSITFEGTTTPTLTIKDGGQLHTNATVTATFEKEIAGYTGAKDNYYLICPPNNHWYSVNPNGTNNSVSNMVTGSFDLYGFDGTQEGAEWRNYKAGAFNLECGRGYLYAHATDTTLKYTSFVSPQITGDEYDYLNWNATAQDVDYLNYNTTTLFGTFNLVGNTLPHNAYVYVGTEETTGFTPVQTYYYKMNDEHNEVVVSNHEVKPWEGIFVQATAEEQYAIIKSDNLGNPALTESLSMSLSQNNSLTDVAIVNFGKGNNLGKFQLNPNHTKLYIPQDDKDYAVVYSEEKAGEMPVSFKAENNGSYTLSFNTENVEFGYLHLIDNMTGEDVNLLETPSYSFEAKTTDYASRFKLVFSTGNGVNEESFAFISDGNIILNGEGMLQVVDVMGRIMMQEENATSVSTNGMTPGVYVLRLINGDSVRTQKIIVK